MTDATDSICLSDAAYLLGSLGAPGRRAFEAHLPGCRDCRRSIAELAPTASVLDRLPREEAVGLLDDEPRDLRARSVHRRAEARVAGSEPLPRGHRRRRRGVVAVAAAVGAVVGGAGIWRLTPEPASPPDVVAGSVRLPMEPAVETAMNATVALTERDWGTQVQVRADYAAGAADLGQAYDYGMYIAGPDGDSELLAVWRGTVGEAARPVATCELDPDEIASVQIRMLEGDRLLLEAEPQESLDG